ncbi:hypothetical protein AYI68_g7897, partial [Smittium mucronatum]
MKHRYFCHDLPTTGCQNWSIVSPTEHEIFV